MPKSPRSSIAIRAGLLLTVCLLLVACQSDPSPSGQGQAKAGGEIDAIRLGGITYTSWSDLNPHPPGVRQLTDSDLAREVARVTGNRLGQTESGPSLRSGEATFLSVGTPIYAVRGYEPTFRLAARLRGQLRLYEPFEYPAARVGADLLGVAGEVRVIGVYDSDGQKQLGAIRNPERVRQLVTLLLRAPVAHDQGFGEGTTYTVTLHLLDGTAVTRSFNATTGYLNGGVMPPEEFTSAIKGAVAGR
jgi:hypothetical protein